MPRESELGPVGGITAVRAPVGGQRLFHAALGGNRVERGNGGKGALSARRAKEDRFAVGGPADHGVGSGVESQLARPAALGGYREDVIIAIAVGRERDVFAVRREARVHVAGLIVGEAL